MFTKVVFVAGLAIGFVAGSAAGREPFNQLKAQLTGVVQDPEVRRKVSEGAEKARTTVQEHAPAVADKAKGAAQSARDKVSEKTGAEDTADNSDEDSLAASTGSPDTKYL